MSAMGGPCECCGVPPPKITSGPWAGQSHLHNYCVHCYKDLCARCLATGKCRESPTKQHEVEPEDET